MAVSKRVLMDRRSLERLRCNFYIDYQLVDSGDFNHGKVINISSSGLCLLPDTMVSIGENISIYFPFMVGTQMILAKVVRIDGREAAVSFEFNESDQEKFAEAFNYEYENRGDSTFLRLNSFE